jgi:pimeloyl-ACP methyl ester carboxylesterase
MVKVQANGITLAYEIHGKGPSLLLISGVGYGGWYWHLLTPRLAHDFQVITFDNRGTGESDKPDGPYSTPQLARDAGALLDALGLPSAYVLGHSLGGFIAQELALARPGLVSKLILASTTFGGPHAIPVTPEALKVMTERSGDPYELFARGVVISTGAGFAERHPEIVQALWDYRASNPVPPAQYQAQVQAGAGHDAEGRIGNLKCPTLILFGAEDKVVPLGNAELLAQKLQGARVEILPKVGHHLALEAPEQVAQVIREFLSE